MFKQVLSGVQWSVYRSIFRLQKINAIPEYPWDSFEIGEEKDRGYDEGFGGEWKILEQEFFFQWNLGNLETPSTKLFLLMRGELPIDPHTKKPIENKEAQRRWFVEKIRIEKPSGNKVGKVDEMTVTEASSKDDALKLLFSD